MQSVHKVYGITNANYLAFAMPCANMANSDTFNLYNMENDSLHTLEALLMVTLDEYVVQARDDDFGKNKVWTYHLKERLVNLAKRYKCSICTSGFKGIHQPEWLYDLVWYKEEGTYPNNMLIDVPLIVEMEWSTNFDQIRYDFEKLLVANAGMRLFVCNIYPNDFEQYRLYFQEADKKYMLSRSGDRYLIAMLVGKERNFRFESIIKS